MKDVEYYDSLITKQKQRYRKFRIDKGKCEKIFFSSRYFNLNHLVQSEKVVDCFNTLGYEAKIDYREVNETDRFYQVIDGKRIRLLGKFCPKENLQNCTSYENYGGYSVKF